MHFLGKTAACDRRHVQFKQAHNLLHSWIMSCWTLHAVIVMTSALRHLHRRDTMAHWHCVVVAVGISALVSCGSPPPDHSASSHTAGSADAVVSPPASAPSSAGLTAHKPAGQSPTQTPLLEPTAQQAPKLGASITNDPRAATPTDNARVQTNASPAVTSQVNQQAEAEQAQREARQSWFTETRENPNASVRLMALELWAQHPDKDIDPRTFALMDDNEQVQARAQELWEQHITRQPEDEDAAP